MFPAWVCQTEMEKLQRPEEALLATRPHHFAVRSEEARPRSFISLSFLGQGFHQAHARRRRRAHLRRQLGREAGQVLGHCRHILRPMSRP